MELTDRRDPADLPRDDPAEGTYRRERVAHWDAVARRRGRRGPVGRRPPPLGPPRGPGRRLPPPPGTRLPLPGAAGRPGAGDRLRRRGPAGRPPARRGRRRRPLGRDGAAGRGAPPPSPLPPGGRARARRSRWYPPGKSV